MITVATAVGCGLVAGLFVAFSVAVMPALRRLPAAQETSWPAFAVASVIGAPPTSRHSRADRSPLAAAGSPASAATIDGGANMTADVGNPRALLERLMPAVNDHDLDGLVACFHEDYINRNPAHPQRGFRGNAQVRRNWTQIFSGVPDVRARVLRSAVDGNSLWSEWEMSGTRSDGGDFDMRGVFIFGVADGRARWARMFLEPIEKASGDADALVTRVAGEPAVQDSGVRSSTVPIGGPHP